MKALYEFDNRVLEQVDVYTKHAAEWCDSLNRSVLGVFGVTDSDFIAYTAFNLAFNGNMESEDLPVVQARFVDAVVSELKQRIKCEFNDVQREFTFWCDVDEGVFEKTPLRPYTGQGNSNLRLSEKSKQSILYMAYRYPDFVPYFFIGIWDLDFIARCVEDGVDAEIARSLIAA